jgi:UDP-glucose 4-epimerase
MNKKVCITGGAGYIGSHCVVKLVDNGYIPIILDNFSNSSLSVIKKIEKITKKKIIFYQVDLRDKLKMKYIFSKHSFNTVIHCAGYKSVSDSIKNPTSYFDNNIQSTISLLEVMNKEKKPRLIFSSSASVYKDGQKLPWKETSKVGNNSNPYAISKYIIEEILINICRFEPRWKIGIARYFNPISNHSSGLINDNLNLKKLPTNLLPSIINVAKKKIKQLKIFGNNYNTRDGTCIRDYIHVVDLAEGHIAILKNLEKVKAAEIFNLGTGYGHTVLEVVKKFEEITGRKIPIKIVKRRKGDIPISFCSPKKAIKKLSWKTKYTIDQSIIDIKSTLKNF